MNLPDNVAPVELPPTLNPAAAGAPIGLPSTIGDLASYDFNVGPHVKARTVVKELERRPELPGVLVLDRHVCIGMASRHKCFEMLSRPYGVEVFLNRPIQTLCKELAIAPTFLPAQTRIDDAVQSALDRPFEQLYEPVIAQFDGGALKLLDLHVLLLAQSRLLANANSLVRQQIEIGRALSSTLELQEVLDMILHHMAEIIPYDRAGIMLQNGPVLEFIAARGFPPQADIRQMRVDILESDIYQEMCYTQQPISIPDVSQQPDWRYMDGLAAARAWAGLPLIHSGYVIGMLSLTRLAADDYSQDELALAQTFAGQAAIALQNARLYAEIKRFNQELESKVQERTEALQAACAKLERLDRTKSDFIGVASHELRTPLTVMSGYTQMLRSDPAIQANQNHSQMLMGIYAGITRLHQVVNSMLDVIKIDSRNLQLCCKTFDLGRLINSLQDEFAPLAAERHQMLSVQDVESLPPIEGDSDALYTVFYHLIVNAIKYTPVGGGVTISAHQPDMDWIEIVVSDTGIGIDPAHHELIFEKFYQTGQVLLHSSGKTKFKGGGPGLGLAIARGIVEAHGGKIWVESVRQDELVCPGSQFHVRLPIGGN